MAASSIAAAGHAKRRRLTMHAMTKIISTKATNSRAANSSSATAAAGGGLALGIQPAVRRRIGRRRRRADAGAEVNAWVVVKPDDTCVIRIARSEMGQGTLTGLAQLVAEELECDWKKVADRIDHARPEPRAQARLGRDGHRRQPRHPHLAGLRAPRRRGRAHDAAAGGGRRVEGAGRRAHASPTASSRTRRPKRTTTYGKVAAAAAKLTPPDPEEHQAQGSEGLEDRRQADEAARHRRQAERQPGLRDRRQAARHAARGDQGSARCSAASS